MSDPLIVNALDRIASAIRNVGSDFVEAYRERTVVLARPDEVHHVRMSLDLKEGSIEDD